MFNPCLIPFVVRATEFRDPKSVIVLYNSFWPCAPHGGADEQEFLDLACCRIRAHVLFANDCVCDGQQFSQVKCLVKVSSRCRRLLSNTKPESACTVIGGVQQIVELTQLRPPCMAFNDPSSPIVRPCISKGTEYPTHCCCFIGSRGKLQLSRVKFYRIRTISVATAIDEPPDRNPVPVFGKNKTPSRYGLCLARQGNVNKAFGLAHLRSHRLTPSLYRRARAHGV